MVQLEENVQYWLEIAEYDLETARAMLQTGRYLYIGFMGHQVIEKALKAVVSSSARLLRIFIISAWSR
jgi:HEPN domain-containing protein